MLIIREEQMQVLRTHRFDLFLSNMMAYLRESYPGWAKSMDDMELAAFVKDSIQKANGLGVQTTDNLRGFLDFCVIAGSDFLSDSSFGWAKNVLASEEQDETEKINRLNEYFVFGAAKAPI